MPIPLRSRPFAGLLLTQSLGSFNDNAAKTLVALLAAASLPPERSAQVVALAGAAFSLPFLLFSPLAGSLADRLSKRDMLIACKGVETLLMALGVFLLHSRSLPLLLGLMLLLGTRAAFFGPAKLSIIPELVEDKDLSQGNGLLQMTAFLGILLGMAAAGPLMERFRGSLHLTGLVLLSLSVLGLLSAFSVPRTPAAGGTAPLRWNFLGQAWEDLAAVREHRSIHLAVAGTAAFWFIGALSQMNLLTYGDELMGLNESSLSLLQVALAVGIALGSYAAGMLSREAIELGLVPLGASGIALFSAALAFSFHRVPLTALWLFLLGASAGVFLVPLQSFIQQRSPKQQRGRFLAAANFLSFAAMLGASALLWSLRRYFHLHAGQVFLVSACMTLAVAAYIIALLPDFLLRLLLYPIANLVYRIRVEGRGNLPLEGGALLVSNHVSFIDAFLIAAASPRLVRFLMFRRYYDLPVLHAFFKAMGCVPISEADSPKALLRSFDAAKEALRAGELVCIFAEGEITRHGQMLRFKKGFERIVEGLRVPVVPVHLDRVWGSIFSFEGGRVLLKRPRRIPYPVTVSFGKAMPPESKAFEVRQAILELGSTAFGHRLEARAALGPAFFREATRHPLRFAMADSSGAKLSHGAMLVKALLLGKALERLEQPKDETPDTAAPDSVSGVTGVFLPPSAGAALANWGLILMGRVPVNLNYTSSREVVAHCVKAAGIRKIVTSRLFLHKLGWEATPEMVFLEDVVRGISKLDALWTGLLAFCLPGRLARPLLIPASMVPLDRTATLIFTSGSTGMPKGVMLTHRNLLSNIEALAQLYQIRSEDRILGALPFFHSFGFTATLLFPPVCGFGVIYHYNPLDAKGIGDLVERHAATFLLGTPTFLQAYLRRAEPHQLRSLRCVVVGAEKLRDDLAKAFEEKFGIPPLEGYGCTELSPVAAANIQDIDWTGVRQRGAKPGTVGQPLPGELMKVVDPETGEPLQAGEAGLLLVKGPNVMKGYLGDPEKTASVLRGGYYVTGDIASIDLDGFVSITDRLSRFSKIGGEMVPHVRLEEKLHELAGLAEQTFVVSAVPDERRGERLVVLHKGYGEVGELLKKLNASGIPKLWIPDKDCFHAVADIPVLGTGKLDMQKIKAMARQKEGL